MGKLRFYVHSLMLFVCVSVSITAVSFAEERRWWGENDQGWFFYKDPVLPEEKKKEEVIERPVPEASSQSPQKQKLFTDSLKEKGAELLSTAMQYPTPENISAYMRWNKSMLDLSNHFAVSWQKELLRDPALQYDIPMLDAAKAVYFQEQMKDEDNAIREIASRAGLFFFYSSTCPYCEKQVEFVQAFASEYGFSVKAISIDGGVFTDFPDTLMDNGISVRLGVDKVPAIFLAFPDEKRFERLSAGLITYAELRQRVMYYAKENDSTFNVSSITN